MEVIIIFGISFICLIGAVIGFIINNSNADEQRAATQAIREHNQQGVSNWLERRRETFNKWRDRKYEQYGKADICLQVKSNEPDLTMLIWKEDKFFLYNNRIVKFADILGCDLSDNKRVVAGQTVATTNTDVWSEIKRDSMVRSFGKTTGTFWAGPLKQSTEIQYTPDKTYHSYTITLTVNDFNNPTIEIKTGDDKIMADKILSLINVMIANK